MVRSTSADVDMALALRARDPTAVSDLLAAFGQEIQAIAYLILRSHADAEEVLMDTMVTAWKHSGDLREQTALRAWLLRIASRHALSRRRSRKATRPLDGEAERIAVREDATIERLAILDELDRLPPQIRAAIVLHYVSGLRIPDVAYVLRKSENTVKTQLKVGRARLHAALRPDGANRDG